MLAGLYKSIFEVGLSISLRLFFWFLRCDGENLGIFKIKNSTESDNYLNKNNVSYGFFLCGPVLIDPGPGVGVLTIMYLCIRSTYFKFNSYMNWEPCSAMLLVLGWCLCLWVWLVSRELYFVLVAVWRVSSWRCQGKESCSSLMGKRKRHTYLFVVSVWMSHLESKFVCK